MPEMPVHDLERYVDVNDALARVCGNKAIYKRLLGTFKSGLQYDQLCREVEAGDLENAARTAHGIKGVTANLSLKAAYEKIVEVESQLKAGQPDTADLDALGDILQTTLRCTDYLTETL